MSSYQYSTQDSIQIAAAPQRSSQHCNFITFLGITQNLSIDFLPITWQQALGNIGKGGTAEISEALLDVNTSFAFKRRLFKESCNSEELTSEILPSVVSEISILLTPWVRHCPHIMDIVGICWDIYGGDDDAFSREKPLDFSSAAIVPVLVFEKSKYGDLHSFMTAGVGKGLGYVERLEFCLEIAKAISVMHSTSTGLSFTLQGSANTPDVVHGDIKPQNVLVFQTSTKIYTVKVADFGYSTVYATDNDLIQMPRSLHWTAPEWHHRGFSFEQAKKMDVYSLALLVFWLLCCNKPDSEEPQDYVTMPESTESAITFTVASLQIVQMLDSAGLLRLFRVAFDRDPADRLVKAEDLRNILAEKRISGPIGKPLSLDGEYPEGITKEEILRSDYLACTEQEVRDHFTPGRDTKYNPTLGEDIGDSFRVECKLSPLFAPSNTLQLVHLIHQLYRADYRVRIYVANCLIDALSTSEESENGSLLSADICIQTALCYELGFGVSRNQPKSCKILNGRMAYELQLAAHLRYIRKEYFSINSSSGIFKWTEIKGTVQFIDRIDSYTGKVGWEKYQQEYRSEIMDASRALGHDNDLVLMLLDQLTDGFQAFGQWQEAEILQTEIVVARIRTRGAKHKETLASMVTLADIYRRQGRLQKAQDLQSHVHEYFSRRGLGLPCRYINAESLALTYAKQGQWENSEELLESVIHHRSATHGHEHPKTLRSRMSLAESYMDRGQYEMAKQLGTQVIEILRRTQGLQQPDTLRCAAVIRRTDDN
ncbi:MAG: hypothetical protein Q9169_005078 [Polycauliona sp. 2 TL-2023]